MPGIIPGGGYVLLSGGPLGGAVEQNQSLVLVSTVMSLD